MNHIPRYVIPSPYEINGKVNEVSYVKGLDFNSQNKYDYNVLNNQIKPAAGAAAVNNLNKPAATGGDYPGAKPIDKNLRAFP